MYTILCEAIAHDHKEREVFLQSFGGVLPKEMSKDLVRPCIKRGHLRHLLKFQEKPEIPHEVLRTLCKEDVVKYYDDIK